MSNSNEPNALYGNQPNEESSSSNRRTIMTAVRSTIVVVGLLIVFLNTIYGFALPKTNVECLVDKTHTATSGINESLNKNPDLRDALLIASALSLDLYFLIRMFLFISESKTWRLMLSFIVFYMIRLVAQLIFQERFPDGYAWEYPGFPSITVSYLKTNDFFFSSQVGLMMICSLEYFKERNYIMMGTGFLVMLIQSLLLIFTRANYSIDVISSAIIAHYVFLLVDDYVYLVDDSPIGLKSLKAQDGDLLVEDSEGKGALKDRLKKDEDEEKLLES